MQTTKTIKTAWLLAVLLCLGLGSAQAALYKADNANNLNVGASWVLGGVPGASDVAGWNSTVQVNTNSALGGNLSWAGIQILNPGSGITIIPGNTLTLGASGIDLSSATASLTLSNALALGANQSWNVASGQTLQLAGVVSGTGNLTFNNSGTIIINCTNTFTGTTTINGGTVQPNGTGLIYSTGSFGVAANNVSINGVTLELTNYISSGVLANNINVAGVNVIDMGSRAVSMVLDGEFTGSGTILVSNEVGGSTLTFGGNGNSNGGNGDFNSFTGTIQVLDTVAAGTNAAGTLRFNNGGTSANLGNPSMTLNLGGPTSGVHFTEKNANTITHFGALIGGPNTQLSSVETYVIGEANLTTTFAGTLTNNAASIQKAGTATLILTGNNYNTGATTVNNGFLQIGDGVTTGAGALGTGAITINSSPTLGTLVFNKPDDFSVTNNISGGGTLIKENTDNMTYYGANTMSGTLMVNQGTLSLGAGGTIGAQVFLASGTFYNVSGNPSFTLASTLYGFGTVNGLLTAAGGTISPGVNNVAGSPDAGGTLNFANGLTENGSVINKIELSSVGNATNDLINVTGDLNVSGVNNFTLTCFAGGQIPPGTYTLLTYSGSFASGSLANFSVTAANNTAVLANPAGAITVTLTPPPRGATNLTWVGDGGANVWDVGTSNWVSSADNVTKFAFKTGDSVRFNQVGAANPTVNLNVTVSPSATNSVVVSNTVATTYTITGSGAIAGATGLVKTNSGTLIMQTANSYTGPTVIGGGTLVASTLANGTLDSSIGAASSNPTNLVFFGSTLSYVGPTTGTDRGATLNGSGGTFDVAPGVTLTNSGTITGPGALTLTDSGTLVLLNPNTYAGGTVLSNGVLALGSNPANNDVAGHSGVGPTNEPVTFYGGALQLYGVGLAVGNNYNTFYNPLVVPAGQTGTLYMFPRGPVNSGAASGLQSSLTGSGTLNLVVNYLRDDLSGNWSAFTGVINATSYTGSDEMRINNNYGYANATIDLNDGVILDRSFTANTTNDIGALNGTYNATVGPGTGSGAYPTYRVGWLNTDATFNGVISDDGVTTIIKVGSGRWTLNGYNYWTGPTIVSNGVLAEANGLSSTNIYICAGAFLDTGGTLYLNTGQTIGGKGTVLGSLDVSGGGTIAPGEDPSISTLTVTNTVNLAGGNTLMEVNHNGGAPVSDQLAAPAISLGGTLSLQVLGSRLQTGDTFHLFNGTLSGSFTTINKGYYTWNISQLGTGGNGTITVTGLLPLPSTGFAISGTNIVLSSTGGLSNGKLMVVTSTNVAAPLSAWTTVTNDVFSGTGQYNLTVPMNPGSAEQFYLIVVF
jgi:fibronectin-binding autotransporter adhesin